MPSPDKKQADERLAQRFAELGVADGRETYRARLRTLKTLNAESFARATRYYDERVVPRIASDADPLDAWIDYGRMIGELTAAGSVVTIDSTGKSLPYRAPLSKSQLVLFLPDDTRESSFVVLQPAEPSHAQQAAIALLVEGRLAL